MDVTLIARDAQGAVSPDPRVFDSAEIPAAERALADLRATVGGARPGGAARRAAGLSPQVQHGAALIGGRGDPQFHPAHPDQRLGQLRHGADRAQLATARPAPESRSSTGGSASAIPYPPPTPPGAVGPGRAARARSTAERSRSSGSAPGSRSSSASRSSGALDLDRCDGADRLRRELPGLVLQLARLRFGMVGPTNHFIELQEVEEVFEPETAAKLGVSAGAADPAVPLGRRGAARGGRRDVRPPEALSRSRSGRRCRWSSRSTTA